MIRVDGLDRVSREEGTDVAEALFKAAAGRIKTLLREHDAVGRYGEDRFLILAHRCEETGARMLGQRIAREIAMTRFAVRGWAASRLRARRVRRAERLLHHARVPSAGGGRGAAGSR